MNIIFDPPKRKEKKKTVNHSLQPLRVQNVVTLIAMEMHNGLEKQDSIHRDAICFRTLFGYVPSLQNTVPFGSKRVAMCLRRKRAEVTNFSTWGGGSR
jgi:hypothetical protein